MHRYRLMRTYQGGLLQMMPRCHIITKFHGAMQAPKEDDERPPGTEDDPEIESSAADPSKQQESAAAAAAAAAAQVSSRQ